MLSGTRANQRRPEPDRSVTPVSEGSRFKETIMTQRPGLRVPVRAQCACAECSGNFANTSGPPGVITPAALHNANRLKIVRR